MPKIIIDGKECEFESGKTVIQVARENGIHIPHFCWHPKLSVSGNCRVCLIEVEKMPKLVISCATMAADGMVIYTNSEKVVKARNSVMEFILANHPLDCPICDEAGECKLQDYAFKYSVGESRFTEEKNHKKKHVELGPYVTFDQERCISCSRCIRFSAEVAKNPQLTFVNRGDKVTIECASGQKFDNPYSMNVVDICPVGALTNTDFRFKSRVWDMGSTKSVCQGCSRGCNIELWTRNNEILRITPRSNEDVNQSWMCDNGRINTFKHIKSETRIDGALAKISGKQEPVSWEDAYKRVYENLKKFKKSEVAFIASPFATLEDNYLLARFVRENYTESNLFFINHIIAEDADDILIKEDKTPNSKGLNLLKISNNRENSLFANLLESIERKAVKALVVLDEDLGSTSLEILSKLEFLLVIASNKNAVTEIADVVLGAAAYAEKNGTVVNFEGRVQRLRPAVKTQYVETSLDGINEGRLDKFGTPFDRWAKEIGYNVKPAWKIFTEMALLFGNKYKYSTAESVFEDFASNVRECKGLDYGIISDKGFVIKP